MTPAEQFAAAGITHVAFVDDDVGERITLAQLAEHDADTAGTLNDPEDPSRMALVELLKRKGKAFEDDAALLEGLNDAVPRGELPERYQKAVTSLLAERIDKRVAIESVRDMLTSEFGITAENIEWFDSPEAFTRSTDFDLVIVDYYLRGPSKADTLPFLKDCLKQSAERADPLLLVLSSSYAASIRDDFRALRQQLGITTSRFRILQKPESASLNHMWKRSLMLLAADRELVLPIEGLVRRIGETVKKAAEQLAGELWELDAHALNALRQVADEDHDDFARYLDECLSRRMLGFLERNTELKTAANALTKALAASAEGRTKREAFEAGDSRRALLELLDDIAWRREPAWQADAAPHDAGWGAAERLRHLSDWFVRNVRFGAVLRDRHGELWLNLTQACDILQSKPAQRDAEVLLLAHGSLTPSVHDDKRRALARSDGFYRDGVRGSVWWNVRRTQSPVINEFITNFHTNEWSVAGELRQDQAQHVLNLYAAQASRVALPNLPRAWRVRGHALTFFDVLDGADEATLVGREVTGDAVREKHRDEERARLYLSYEDVQAVIGAYQAFAGEDFEKFYDGVEVGVTTSKEKGKSKLRAVYMAKPGPTFAELRKAFVDEKVRERLADPDKRAAKDNELWVVLSPDFR
jgi:hypothetical protein